MNLDPHFICYTKINSTWTEGLNEIMKALKDQEKTKDIESLATSAQCLAAVSSPNLWVVDWRTDGLWGAGLDVMRVAADQKAWTNCVPWHLLVLPALKHFWFWANILQLGVSPYKSGSQTSPEMSKCLAALGPHCCTAWNNEMSPWLLHWGWGLGSSD